MRHYKARQLEGGGWHYTCRRDDDIRPVGNCVFHGGHETENEACDCYKWYLITNEIHDDLIRGLKKCEVCDMLTSHCVRIGSGMGTYFSLCGNHNNLATLDKLFNVGESWES
jgi:hypothetical protein